MAKKKAKAPAKKKKAASKKRVPKIKVDLAKVPYCPDCGADNIFYSEMRDEIICRACGGIFSHLTDEQMEKYGNIIASN